MDWHNFYLGFFLWLTSSGLLLSFFKGNASGFANKTNNQNKLEGNNSSISSPNNQSRIEELEKQLETTTTALNLAQSQIQELEGKLNLTNRKLEESEGNYSRSQQKLQDKTMDFHRQIEVLKQELKNNINQIEDKENKYNQSLKQWQNQTNTFQEQIEALQEELQITSDQLELTQNKYFNSQQDFEEQATNYQDKIDILEAKNKKLLTKLEQLPIELQSNWQKESINLLQELLISYPTAKLMVELKHNLPSKNILALLKPLELLLQEWGIETIGKPWKKVPYNPNIHDCGEEDISQGELVYIRWVGYYQGDRVLLPAKVSRKLPGQNRIR
jgi:hypothetical protein